MLNETSRHEKHNTCLMKAPHHEEVQVSGSTALRILNFGTTRGWVVSFTPWQFCPRGKSPPVPTGKETG